MATGDNHQQWGFSHYPQQGQDPGQAGNFVNQGFGESGNDAFTIAQQWQAHDNQFLNEPDFSAYQSQGSGYPIQQPAQHFSGASAHAQSHQHPQTYTTPIAMNGAQDMSWDYGFGFENNHLRSGMGGEDASYVSGLQQDRNTNGVPSTRSYPQAQELPNNVPAQSHFGAESAGNHAYTPSQNPVYGRSIQQSPPQNMAQPLQQQRQLVDYQQQPVHQQQQPAVSQHRQPGMSQHQPTIAHQQQPVVPQQHQSVMPQHQPPISHHHGSVMPPQHQQLPQGGIQQQQQLQNANHAQQGPRIGTPQSHSATPTTQPRQSPFNGRGVPPLSMQQQAQFSTQPGRSSPAIPFSAPQQQNVQMAGPKASPSHSNVQTTQSRFVPQHMAPAQQFSQSTSPSTTNVGASGTTLNARPQTMQPSLQGVAHPMQQSSQANHNTTAALAGPPQEPISGGLLGPRVLRRDDKAIPSCGSRFIGFSLAQPIPIGEDAESNRTIDEILDPSHSTEIPFGNLFPEQPNGQRRVFATDLLRDWTKAVDEGDVASQTALELRLNQQLGGSIPKYYDDRLKRAVSAKKKASAKHGPERSQTRPTDEADAAEWDALGLVYLTNPQPTSQEIGEAVAAFGKLIRGYAADMQKLKSKLKIAKDADSAPLQKQIDYKLECIYRGVAAANTWGDPQILANLGGNQKLISDFVTCLIHANNSADHNGKIPRAVLHLLSMVTTIDEDFLMTSLRFAMISKKFDAKGDAEIKDFVQKIRQHAAARKAENAKDESKLERISTPEPISSGYKGTAGLRDAAKKSTAASTTSRASSTTSASSSTVKRPRDEEADTKPAKRVASESTSSLSSQKVAPGKVVVPAPISATQTKLFGSGMLGVKKTVTKPATKLSGKSDGVKAEGPTVAKKEPLKLASASKVKKPESTKAEAPSASKLGGISALLDSISNAKAKPNGRSTPDKEVKPEKDETPEEKARRLRKEKRRHLRVSWKQGEDLTEVRLFHKDAEEDEGRASNMIRDAHDDRSEGMMLKQGLMSAAQDDDDEEDELPYRPWCQPTAVDFSLIPTETRSKFFVTRAGEVEFETEQQKLIGEYNNKELMVVYTDPSDIPPTPKSPHPQSAEDTNMDTGTVYDLAQDDPKLAEIHLRWGEANSRGFSWARLNALRRAQKGQSATLSDVANMQASAASAISIGTSPTKPISIEEHVFDLLTSNRVKNYKDPNPIDPANLKTQRRRDYVDTMVQLAVDKVENVAAQLKGKPFPPTQPPEWMSDDKANEWWHGYNKDMQRAEHQAQQHIRMQGAQSQHAAQPQPTTQAASIAADPNAAAWAAYYAQVQQQQQAQPQTVAQDPNAAAWAAYYAQQQQAAAAPTQPVGDSNAQLQAVLAALSGAPAQPQQQPATQSSTDPQLQALLASLGATSAAQQSAQAYQSQPTTTTFQAPNPNDPNYLAYIMSLAGQPADQAAVANGNGTRQARDDSRERDNNNWDRDTDGMHPSRRGEGKSRGGSRGGRGGGGGGGGNGGDVPPHLRGINREKIGTKPCTFWAKGTCQKGEQCTFRHD
ncbi:hypothetical protein N0V93_000385 [Gnomoniopsis smithogilvyi]|uniref:C3H1-type domain-containing protein n=1 Tax=Gnomoniopsis smithogilvyi TaxID=1191159 RepID=A0A9W8Z1I0_9PEZI|nr:hypothetical protein N0V93_000385 [Gnomoniopsis smithogilvyi]